MRQVVLDTETTGLDPRSGHRIIEIGCVEMVNRRLTGNNYHQYINPNREVEQGAIDVHGITNEFLTDKPVFEQIADAFFQYIKGAELIIHNAAFDVGFIDHEFGMLPDASRYGVVHDICKVTDTLRMARKKHRGQKNNLDALCKRYDIENSHRELHGALLDSEILADVYLAMTGGQTALLLDRAGGHGSEGEDEQGESIQLLKADRPPLRVIMPDEEEAAAHQALIDVIRQRSGASINWG